MTKTKPTVHLLYAYTRSGGWPWETRLLGVYATQEKAKEGRTAFRKKIAQRGALFGIPRSEVQLRIQRRPLI